MTCSFCGSPLEQVHKMIDGPGVTICDRCVVRARDHAAIEALDMPCSFCRKAEGVAQYRTDRVVVCDPCVELCIEILREAQVALPPARVVRR